MSITLGLSPWLFALLILVAAGGAFWAYRNTVPAVTGGGRLVLSTLRFLSLAILIFLLVEPLLSRTSRESDQPVIAVLVDDSQSVVAATGGPDSSDAAGAIQGALSQIQRNLPEADLRVFRFGTALAPASPESLSFAQGRTDIARALDEAAAELESDNLQGIILVSDGRYNTGRNPVHVADRFPVPIHTITVGDTTAQRDVQIRRVLTNELAYKDVLLPMEVGIRHAGFPGQVVTVRVLQGGRVLDQEQLTLPESDGETSALLEVLPDTTGLIRYDVSVTRSDGEFTYRNNTFAVSVLVLESRQRVLLLAGAPSPDLTGLRGALGTNDDLELDLLVRKPSGGYFQGAFPDASQYDLLMLAGYPSTGTDLSDIDAVARAITGGKPVLFLLGHTTDLRLMQRLGPALPVQPRVVRSGRVEGRPVLSPAGVNHPALSLPDIPDDVWNALPPLRVTDVTWQSAADAQVLATAAIRGVTLDDPVLVVRRRSGARSAAILASDTWRWANLPESLSSYEDTWPTLVGNLVQWLSAPEDDRPVRVRPSTASYEGGEPIEFYGQVYDESSLPVSGATVDIDVLMPDGSSLPFAMRSIGSGRYRADAGTLPEGAYTYTASATANDVLLGEDRGAFSVGPLALEFRETRADADLMRQIALRAGGASAVGISVDGLSDAIAQSDNFQARERVVASSVRLWHRYPFLVIVLVLLTIEWFLRKRRGLV